MTKNLTSLTLPAVLLAAALSLTACGGGVKDGNSVEGSDFASPTTITYNGHPLYCIDQGHGLTCDWVRYHAERGDLLPK